MKEIGETGQKITLPIWVPRYSAFRKEQFFKLLFLNKTVLYEKQERKMLLEVYFLKKVYRFNEEKSY